MTVYYASKANLLILMWWAAAIEFLIDTTNSSLSFHPHESEDPASRPKVVDCRGLQIVLVYLSPCVPKHWCIRKHKQIKQNSQNTRVILRTNMYNESHNKIHGTWSWMLLSFVHICIRSVRLSKAIPYICLDEDAFVMLYKSLVRSHL